MKRRIFFLSFIVLSLGVISGLLLKEIKLVFLLLFLLFALLAVIFRRKAGIILLAAVFMLGAARASYEYK